jgi:hypothetical protein
MSKTTLAEILADVAKSNEICERATAGPWIYGVSPNFETKDELLKYLESIADFGQGYQIHMVCVKNERDDYDDALIVAITGNGPNSKNNALFDIHAREALPEANYTIRLFAKALLIMCGERDCEDCSIESDQEECELCAKRIANRLLDQAERELEGKK